MTYVFFVCLKGGILRFEPGSEGARQALLAGLPQIPDSELRRVTAMQPPQRRDWAAHSKGLA